MSGDGATAVVGAHADDDRGSNSGSVYVYDLSVSPPTERKLTASDGAVDDLFGYSVAVSGDGATVVTGAHRHHTSGSYSGAAYVFGLTPTPSTSTPGRSSPHFSLVADHRSFWEGHDGMERVTVTPETPRVGETVTLEVTVTNVGTRGGRYVGRLTNWFETLGREEVYLDVGEKTTLTYEFAFEKAGTHRMFLTDDHICDITVTR